MKRWLENIFWFLAVVFVVLVMVFKMKYLMP